MDKQFAEYVGLENKDTYMRQDIQKNLINFCLQRGLINLTKGSEAFNFRDDSFLRAKFGLDELAI